jgi:6-phospho-beta-glucosidase
MIPNEYLVYYERPGQIAEAFRRGGATRAQVLLEQESGFYGGPEETPEKALASWRRTRDARYSSYMAEAWAVADRAIGSGATPPPVDEGPGAAGYAAIAASFLGAARGDGGSTLVVNAANRGRLPFLPDDAVIEAPCAVGPAGLTPLPCGPLSARQRDLVERVKEVERLTIRAAVEGSARLALDAIAANPIVPSRAVAERIFAGYLAGHRDLREHLR